MRPVFPPHPLVVGQSDVGLVHQRRSLQTVPTPLPPHVVPRQPVQLFIHDGRQFLQSLPISLAPRLQQPAHLATSGCLRRFTYGLLGVLHSPTLGESYPAKPALPRKVTPDDSSALQIAPI